MKKEFIEGVMKRAIKYKDYMPLADEEGKVSFDEKVNVLIKNAYGSFIVLNFVDGDRLTAEEIKQHLENSAKGLLELSAAQQNSIVEIFVFDYGPDQEKIDAMTTSQIHKAMAKRFLKCMSINLYDKKLTRYFKVPFGDYGIGKLIKSQFEGIEYGNEENEDLDEILNQKKQENQFEYKVKVPYVTYILIAINILVAAGLFLYSLNSKINYDKLLVDFGAKENGLIINGEYWRFITAVFLHADIKHLAFNCYSLYAIGMSAERIYGRFKYITIFIVAGIMGNIASFAFSSSPGVGASGAIFGLLGAMLYFGIEKPAIFKKYFGINVIIVILINLGYGFTNAGIDNSAHIGGLIGGFLTTGALSVSSIKRWFQNKYLYISLIIIVAYAGIYYGFNNNQNKIVLMINQLEQYNESNDWVGAEKIAGEILDLKPSDNNTKSYALRSSLIAKAVAGKFPEAIEQAKQMVLIDPKNGHYLLGLLYLDTKEYESAKNELLQAKELKAEYDKIDDLIKEADDAIKGNK